MSGSESQERHLLFALLAFQNDFINHEQLLKAFSTWVIDKSIPLDQVLVGQGAISDEDRSLFERLVNKHLERFDGDASQSLANLSGVSSVREELARIAGDDIATLQTITLLPASPVTEFATIVSDSQGLPSKTTTSQSASSNRFRILRQHARGGLGVVFLAQDQDLSREVAMKQIRHDRADEEGYRLKFLQEAEVTGQLEHPGIVPVYALGVDANGRPFYAMRFIRGEDLQSRLRTFHRARAKEHTRLDGPELRGLLRRFVDVCNAIQYAHDRGVLHRDLKPGNVMLGKHGETLVVDWGLAKPFEDSEQEDHTATIGPHVIAASFRSASAAGSETREGTFIGTPAYAPPEQVLGQIDKLGPRSDVYSLGAILYEVLTGKVPVSGTTVAEVITKATTGDFPAPRTIDADIPKPLEAICRKAMAVKQDERYASAEMLRRDIENWLDDAPVEAYREPLVARMHRILRKNPVTASWIAAVVLMGLLGAVGFAVVSANHNRQLEAKNIQISNEKQAAERARDEEKKAKGAAELAFIQERQARDAAELAREQERQAKNSAVQARNQAVGVRNFLVDIFQQPDPSRDGRKVTVFESMASGIKKVRGDFENDPETAIVLLTAIYQSYTGLGLYKEAQQLINEVLELRKEHGLEAEEGAFENRNDLGKNFKLLGKYAEAIKVHEELVQQCVQQFGEKHPLTLQVQHDLANAYRAAGRLQDALRINQTVYQARLELLGNQDPDTLSSQNTLANSLEAVGQRGQALAIRRENYAARKAILGPNHPDTLASQNNLATALLEAGQLQESLEPQTATYEGRKEVLGLDHPDTLGSLHNLANVLLDVGRNDDAEGMYRDATEGLKTQLSPRHPSTLAALSGLGQILLRLDKKEEAMQIFESVHAAQSEVLGPAHPQTLATLNNLASIYDIMGDHQRGIQMLQQAVALATEGLGAEHEATVDLKLTLSAAYGNNGQINDMDALCQELAPLTSRLFGPTHPIALKAQNNLAVAFLVNHEYEQALEIYRQLEQTQRLALGEDHPETIRTEFGILQTLLMSSHTSGDVDQLENGLVKARQTLEKVRRVYKAEHTLALDALDIVGQFCLAVERVDEAQEAKTVFFEEVQLRVKRFGISDESTVWAGVRLSAACEIASDWALAEAVSSCFARELVSIEKFRAFYHEFAFRRGYALSKLGTDYNQAEALMKTSLTAVEALADPPSPPLLSVTDMRSRMQEFLLAQGRKY